MEQMKNDVKESLLSRHICGQRTKKAMADIVVHCFQCALVVSTLPCLLLFYCSYPSFYIIQTAIHNITDQGCKVKNIQFSKEKKIKMKNQGEKLDHRLKGEKMSAKKVNI